MFCGGTSIFPFSLITDEMLLDEMVSVAMFAFFNWAPVSVTIFSGASFVVSYVVFAEHPAITSKMYIVINFFILD
jgi:hypothetical protein